MTTDNKYVIVTTISTHRMRYCVPLDDLRHEDGTVDPKWAMDAVTMQEVKEFSQVWLGEQIVDWGILDQEGMLEQFDQDNDYLKGWSTEQKIKWVEEWKDVNE